MFGSKSSKDYHVSTWSTGDALRDAKAIAKATDPSRTVDLKIVLKK